MQAKILFYNMENDARMKKIRRFCNIHDISYIMISRSEYMETIGSLLQIPGFPRKNILNFSADFSDEMLVLQGFSNQLLDEFLTYFKENEIEPVALKAIITPHNASWNSIYLHDELLREKAAMENK